MNDIRIAAVISNSPAGHVEYNIERMTRWVTAAKKEGADLVCFPEMNITGYSIHEDIKNVAEPVPGPISEKLLQMAQARDIAILAGMAEKDEAGRVYATHLVAKPAGVSRVYRKLHIAPPERGIFSPGKRVLLFNACGIKFGIQLCYDAHFPEISTFMAIREAGIIFIPHASPNGTPEEKFRSWMRHLPARAYDNSLFVVACNQSGDNGEGLEFPGIAVIIGPSGEIIEKNVSGKEGMILADLKAETLEKVRGNKMRFFLPNRRPDLYKILNLEA